MNHFSDHINQLLLKYENFYKKGLENIKSFKDKERSKIDTQDGMNKAWVFIIKDLRLISEKLADETKSK